MSRLASDKEVRKLLVEHCKKYVYVHKGKQQKAKIKLGVKLRDYLVDFILDDGCHLGFSISNYVSLDQIPEFMEYVDSCLWRAAENKKVKLIPVEKTWKLGSNLYD